MTTETKPAVTDLNAYVLERAEALGRKFEADDMHDGNLITASLRYVANYSGSFSFMVDMQARYKRYGLNHKMLKGVANCLVAELRRQKEASEAEDEEPALDESGKHIVRNGTYTVDMGDGSHVTLRLKAPNFGNFSEVTQVAQYLSGPDNESSYTGFAFVKGRTSKTWRKYQGAERLEKALRALLCASPEEAAELGLAYAMESGNCYRCGRKLTVPASICAGLGPVCAKK